MEQGTNKQATTRIRIGYTQDWTGASTNKIQILAETTDGRYVCEKAPEVMTNIYGRRYLSYGINGMFLRAKVGVTNIHDEELEID